MKQKTSITIEHVVVASERPYEKVIEALEHRLGKAENWREILQPFFAAQTSWEQVTKAIEPHIGASGLMFFYKIEHSPFLFLAGKKSRANQYTLGNPLFATQMSRYTPEVALYAPLKLVVYENENGNTFIAYDSFVSLLAQYRCEEINQVAQLVEQKLETLVAEVTSES